ncbi:MAG: glutathione peroxidase [Terracidiphilus sp.]|jgi:glutathione peroxidase
MKEAGETVYEFSAPLLAGGADGRPVSLAEFRGQVLLIVNTASKCGNTPQYAGLEKLYRDYKERGLTVLGFPCNQFGAQEPGSAAEIASFCERNYGVSFPLFAKIEVNGSESHPLYRFLRKAKPGIFGTERIKWNFTKFLVDRQGRVVRRYAPTTQPKAIVAAVEGLLDSQ